MSRTKKRRQESGRSNIELDAVIVFVVALAGFVLLTPSMIERLNPVTGDEPFYLMTAISIWKDQDLDETRNYAERDFERFYPDQPLAADWQGWPSFPDPLPPHPTHSEREGLYSKHGLGLSVLITPVFNLTGRVGVVVMLNVIAALVAANSYLLAKRYLQPLPGALLTLLLVFTIPIAPYGFLIFPELPAALLVLYTARRLLDEPDRTWQWLLLGLALAFLPWLHNRFLPISIVAFLLIVFQLRLFRQPAAVQTAVLAPALISGGTYLAFLYWLYGRFLPPIEDHAGFSGLTGTVNGGFGLLLDAQWGLVIYAPIYLLAIALIPRFYGRTASDARTMLLLILPYLVLIASYRVWWGEWGPPGRYLVPIVLLGIAPLASWLRDAQIPGWLLTGGLGAFGAILTAVGLADPQRLYQHPDGMSKLYRVSGESLGIAIDQLLTAFQPYAMSPLQDRLASAAALLAASLLLLLLSERISQGRHT